MSAFLAHLEHQDKLWCTPNSSVDGLWIRELFSLMLIFLVLVVLLDSQDSTTELQKAVETPDVALGEHYLPQEVSGMEMKETGKAFIYFKQSDGSGVFICS